MAKNILWELFEQFFLRSSTVSIFLAGIKKIREYALVSVTFFFCQPWKLAYIWAIYKLRKDFFEFTSKSL